MTGKLHRFGGACSGIITTAALCSQLPQTTNGNMLLVMSGALLGGIGGLLPDIDTPHSIISLKHPIISWVVCKFTEHRMAIHTLIIPMFLAVLTQIDTDKSMCFPIVPIRYALFPISNVMGNV